MPQTAAETLAYLADRFAVDVTRPSPIEVPKWCRNDLPKLFSDLGYRRGAEIGVWTGAFSEALCRANPALYLTCVDPWIPYPDYRDNREKRKYPDIYDTAVAALAPFHCEIVRKFSTDAVKDVPLNSLDFVYIDGNHAFEFVVEDLAFWSRRVRPGGIVSGHDYRHYPAKRGSFHVVEAVNAFTSVYRIAPWFVLGLPDEAERQIQEHQFRSYLWVRPA